MRLIRFLSLVVLIAASFHVMAFAQDAPREATLSVPEAPEVHLPSIGGGTGMLWGRGGMALREDEKNISLFYEFMKYDTIPLLRTRMATDPMLEDPRGDEHWASIVFNYGVTDWFEVGIKVPFVFGDRSHVYWVNPTTNAIEEKGIDNLRGSTIGRTTVDARLRILHHERFGLGIVAGIFADAPGGKDATSEDVTFKGELGLTLEGKSFGNYLGPLWFDKYILEPLNFHGAVSWGTADYLRFKYYPPPEWRGNPFYPKGPISINRDYSQPEFIASQYMHLNFGFTYEPYEHFTIGSELLVDQFPDQENDNNLMITLPEVRYNWRNIWSFHGGFGFTGVRRDIDDQPDWMAGVGATYHFWWPETAKSVAERLQPTPIDLYEILVPSRKPIPTEEPISTDEPASDDGELDMEPE